MIDKRIEMPLAGLNDNFHRDAVADATGALAEMGVTYLGNGEWDLPDGASIIALVGNHWFLVMGDGSEWYVWSDDDPVGVS